MNLRSLACTVAVWAAGASLVAVTVVPMLGALDKAAEPQVILVGVECGPDAAVMVARHEDEFRTQCRWIEPRTLQPPCGNLPCN